MSIDLRFASYLRRGMARLIGETADASGIPQDETATVTIRLQTAETPIERAFPLLGPGAITGLVAGEVLRVDPPSGTQDHPPNLFPGAELRTPDLPWRYTPAQPNRENLLPWLVLVVVTDRPGMTLRPGSPLPVLRVDDVAELPDLQEAWAWAHVQVGTADDDLDRVLEQTPEAIWGRLLCPRYLEPDTPYLACIVPSFEVGRLAGLGISPASASLGDLAWTTADSAVELPVYHSWRFRTATQGADFEELVRRLTPITLTPDVGVHPLDLSDPGSAQLPQAPVVVGFEGALVSPVVELPTWRNPHRKQFQSALGDLLAAATPGTAPAAGEDYDPARHDPVVAPPRYGLLPAGLDEVPAPGRRPSRAAPRWLSESNLDPRHRAVAGLGTEVVRRNQERLMAQAWDQAIGISRVNRVLGQTRLALEVGRRRHVRALQLADASALQLTSGAHPRLKAEAGFTVLGSLRASDLPSGTVSAAFRRQMRAGAPFAKALRRATLPRDASTDVTRRLTERLATTTSVMLRYADLTVPHGTWLNAQTATAADGKLIDGIEMGSTPISTDFDDWASANRGRLERRLGRSGSPAAARWRRRFAAPPVAPQRRPTASSPTAFIVHDPVGVARRVMAQSGPVLDTRSIDSVFGGIEHVLTKGGAVSTTASSIDLQGLAAGITAQLDPTAVLAARLRHIIRPATALGAEPVPASIWASPSIDTPLYAEVVRIDPELLMPGVGDLTDESVGLAVINAAYVEVFLLGANHELAREMVWREYPADLAGTWLRMFWDHAATGVAAGGDIPPIAGWLPGALGTHPEAGTDPARTLVLVIKGELVRRYPNTLISAVPARWRKQDGRVLREEDTDAAVLAPVFAGSLGRNVMFVGFEFESAVDLERDVRGSPQPKDASPGWYFVFEEPPTEPCFGLDTAASDTSPDLKFWKDLTWADARTGDQAQHVQLEALSATLPYDSQGANRWTETWADSAAAMARITLQRPVRMLVHADQMLRLEPAR